MEGAGTFPRPSLPSVTRALYERVIPNDHPVLLPADNLVTGARKASNGGRESSGQGWDDKGEQSLFNPLYVMKHAEAIAR